MTFREYLCWGRSRGEPGDRRVVCFGWVGLVNTLDVSVGYYPYYRARYYRSF